MKKFCIIFFSLGFLYANEDYENLIGYVYRNANPKLAKEYHATAITQWQYGNIEAAISRFKASCNLGLGISCATLGDIYKKGLKEVPQNKEQSLTFYNLACALGDTDSCKEIESK